MDIDALQDNLTSVAFCDINAEIVRTQIFSLLLLSGYSFCGHQFHQAISTSTITYWIPSGTQINTWKRYLSNAWTNVACLLVFTGLPDRHCWQFTAGKRTNQKGELWTNLVNNSNISNNFWNNENLFTNIFILDFGKVLGAGFVSLIVSSNCGLTVYFSSEDVKINSIFSVTGSCLHLTFNSSKEADNLKRRLDQQSQRLTITRKECHRRRLLLLAQQRVMNNGPQSYHRCPHCTKAFINASFLNAHLFRRHSEMVTALQNIEFNQDNILPLGSVNSFDVEKEPNEKHFSLVLFNRIILFPTLRNLEKNLRKN